MAYIFNTVLACWLDEDGYGVAGPSNSYLNPDEDHPRRFETIEALVEHWNKHPNIWKNKIHYPCIKEHFEVYETLPDWWDTCVNKE